MAEQGFQFSLQKIVTEQFAIITHNVPESPETQIEIGLRLGLERKARIIAVSTRFTFLDNGMPFLLIEATSNFEIAPETWELEMKNGHMVPRMPLSHLVTLAVGATRGILHAKTENTPFNKYILPTINVLEMVNEDYVFEDDQPKQGV